MEDYVQFYCLAKKNADSKRICKMSYETLKILKQAHSLLNMTRLQDD